MNSSRKTIIRNIISEFDTNFNKYKKYHALSDLQLFTELNKIVDNSINNFNYSNSEDIVYNLVYSCIIIDFITSGRNIKKGLFLRRLPKILISNFTEVDLYYKGGFEKYINDLDSLRLIYMMKDKLNDLLKDIYYDSQTCQAKFAAYRLIPYCLIALEYSM